MTASRPLDRLLPSLDAFNQAKPGQRLDLPALAGSSDALAIARLAGGGKMLVVVTANPLDAQRLSDEIAWLAPDLRTHLLPDWETLPYDSFSPHQDLISERLSTLYAITRGEADIALVPASTALYRLAPPAFLAAYTFFLKQGARLDVDGLRNQMTIGGYAHVTQVVSPGEFSVRGGLVDLFPMGAALPYRIDLFDDEIESIKTFDPDTQRTVFPVKEVRLLPAREFPMDETGRTHFRGRFRETFEGDPSRCAVYKDVSNGIAPAGIEYYLPLFFDETATLFDYLPDHSRILLHRDVPGAIEAFWKDARSRHHLLGGDKTRPIMAPDQLFLSEEAFFIALKERTRLALPAGAGDGPSATLPDISVERKANDPLHRFKAFCAGFDGRVLVLAESAGRQQTIAEYFAEYSLKPEPSADFDTFLAGDAKLALGTGPLAAGFVLPDAGIAVVTESELYAATARTRTRRDSRKAATMEGWLRDLSELKPGDPVVHSSHGIGRYMGLVHMDLGEGQTEFLHLEYANGDKLYVPVSQLHVITRYAGADPEAVHLHTLGSGQWEKAKKKAAQQVRDTAAELLALYAQRAARKGHQFDFKQHDLEAFADGFGFEETPDQLAAIEAVVADMKSGRPMDRLVCGDVGFGKTEVALRAMFVAVTSGKQVALLAPTTLLAEQHYQNIADRFAQWPVRVAEMSRFRSAKEIKGAMQGLEDGTIDIVVGTHKLLSESVKFKRLGLLIIDEEHRFGVRHKEAIKAMRADIDVLTLTATPIPRTLGMAMEGLRDLSVIATAPQRRLAIKTFVRSENSSVIREAVLRELKRGGQVYFLHNEVDTIENRRDKLVELLPEARIAIAHGQMPERELERVMRDFVAQRHNVLLCSTIIETGIDVPSANTIVISRADKFGLAQLHQLRGRVGRSHHQAYAYLLVQDDKAMTKQAKQRLEAIQMSEELGSGFFLAMHDLEIRGAGEVLGENQAGDMQEVGFNVFTDMLNRAVAHLKQGKAIDTVDLTQPLGISTEINLRTPALLPDAYCPDVHERLTLYKRLANCETAEDIDAMQEELIDRFGELPLQGQSLLATHRLRLVAKPLCIQKLDAATDQITLQFGPEFSKNPPIEPIKIIHLIQNNRNYKLAGQDKISLLRHCPSLNDKVAAVKDMIRELTK